jgi:histidyl-tRNA synthetase
MAIVDKIRKVDKAQTTQSFAELGLSAEHIRVLWQLCESTFPSVHALFQALQTWNCLNVEIEKTLTNLSALESALTERCLGATFCFDLSIVRGLDYYTGLVVEGFLQEAPHLGAVLSGGRYDNLTQSLGRGKPLPGVGFSLGLTRIFSYALAQNLFSLQQQSTARMAIANLGPHYEGSPWQVACVFRKRGIACALLHEAGKLGKQMMYCEKRGIPYLVFPEDNSYNRLIVRNLIEKTQAPCDVHVFNPCS